MKVHSKLYLSNLKMQVGLHNIRQTFACLARIGCCLWGVFHSSEEEENFQISVSENALSVCNIISIIILIAVTWLLILVNIILNPVGLGIWKGKWLGVLLFYFILFFCSARYGTRGPKHARQVLHWVTVLAKGKWKFIIRSFCLGRD